MIKYYAVRHKSLDVVKSSRSGGFFTALSDYVLQHNGIIYGCAFNAELEVVHIRATTFAEGINVGGQSMFKVFWVTHLNC